MTRQSISLTKPNDDWLKAQVASQEYTSKSEVMNDLIRRAREVEMLRHKLIAAEAGGFVEQSPEAMLEEFKAEARRNGKL